MKLLVVGAGYTGRRIARALAGDALSVAGTTRSDSGVAALTEAGIQGFSFDAAPPSPAFSATLSIATHLVITAPPDVAGDPVLRALGPEPERSLGSLEWVGYLSTVGVYGDHGGAWVDERTPPDESSPRSRQRLAAEQGWTALGTRTGAAVAILRLPGIYGPGRNALASLVEGQARRILKSGQVFNRVHVDDIAGASALFARRRWAGVVNVTDDLPAPPDEVVAFAAALMGVDAPPLIAFEEAQLSPAGREFYSANRRVSNARLRAEGYALAHPDYREGLTAMWRSGTWR